MKGKPPLFFPFSLTVLCLGSPLLSTLLAMLPVASAQAQFSPPPVGAPGNREAGAARSDTCASTAATSGLMAVIPSSNLGLTTQAYPTFFAYMPPNNAARTEFRLIEETTNQEVYAGQVQMPATDPANPAYKHQASVVGFPLPRSAPALETGKKYLWALLLVCNAKNRAEDVVVTGVIQRADNSYLQALAPAVKQKLSKVSTAPAQEQISIYGSAGIWHDMLNQAATRVQGQPTASSQWSTLLTNQGMGAISTTPLFQSAVTPLQP